MLEAACLPKRKQHDGKKIIKDKQSREERSQETVDAWGGLIPISVSLDGGAPSPVGTHPLNRMECEMF